MKEWTGAETNDWMWSDGEIIDAAAIGSEMELEVPSGNTGYTLFLGTAKKSHPVILELRMKWEDMLIVHPV